MKVASFATLTDFPCFDAVAGFALASFAALPLTTFGIAAFGRFLGASSPTGWLPGYSLPQGGAVVLIDVPPDLLERIRAEVESLRRDLLGIESET